MTYEEYMNKAYSEIIKECATVICNRIVNKIVRLLQSFKRGSNMMQSPKDSGLDNIWDEICVQTQGQEFIMWGAYEKTMFNLVEDCVSKCTETEKKMLWFQTESFWDWYVELDDDNPDDWFDKDGFPSAYEDDSVINYVYDELINKSMNYTNQRIENYI